MHGVKRNFRVVRLLWPRGDRSRWPLVVADVLWMDVGRHIQAARVAAGLTQTELAEKADVHRTYVSMLERNTKSPTLDVLFRLCKAMNTAPSKLLANIEADP